MRQLMSWRGAAISGALLAGLALGFGAYCSAKIVVDALIHVKTARGGRA